MKMQKAYFVIFLTIILHGCSSASTWPSYSVPTDSNYYYGVGFGESEYRLKTALDDAELIAKEQIATQIAEILQQFSERFGNEISGTLRHKVNFRRSVSAMIYGISREILSGTEILSNEIESRETNKTFDSRKVLVFQTKVVVRFRKSSIQEKLEERIENEAILKTEFDKHKWLDGMKKELEQYKIDQEKEVD